MPQTYGNVPAALNVSDPLWFWANTGVWPTPFTTALCAAASLLVHVTVSPTLIVRLAGTKANPEMLTLAVAPAAADASAMNRRRVTRAASHAARGLIGGGAACRRARAGTGRAWRYRRRRRRGLLRGSGPSLLPAAPDPRPRRGRRHRRSGSGLGSGARTWARHQPPRRSRPRR